MNLDLQMEELKCYSCVLDTVVRREETQEAIVPDALPDIKTILSVTGTPYLSHSTCEQAAVSVQGKVNALVVYESDRGEVHSISVQIPFQCALDAPGVNSDCVVTADVMLRFGEAKTFNPRKILARCEVSVHVCCYKTGTMTYALGIMNAPVGLQLKYEHADLQYISYAGEKVFSYEDSFTLAAHRDIACINGCDYVPYCTESRLTGNKLIFKGGVKVSVKYTDQTGVLCLEECDLSVSQVMDAGQTPAGCYHCVTLSMVDAQAVLHENNCLDLALELSACAVVYAQKQISYLADAYSTKECCECETGRIHSLIVEDSGNKVYPFRHTLDTEFTGAEVVGYHVWLCEVTENMDGTLNCRMQLSCTLATEEGRLTQSSHTFYIPLSIATQGVNSVRVSANLLDFRCQCAAGALEVRGNIHLTWVASEELEFSMLNALAVQPSEAGEQQTSPSVVLRRLHPGETLWDLGKCHRASVDDIKAVNKIADESGARGKMLLIPRCR